MTVQQLIDASLFEVCCLGEDTERIIEKVYCCDLLSFAMGKAPANCAWITVIGNINTLAVATLADTSCIILSEGAALDDAAAAKAKIQGITVLHTDMPSFEAALAVHRLLPGACHPD